MGCLRLFIALLVMLNHGIYAGYIPRHFFGFGYTILNLRLFFFFLLSGFMIAYLLREKTPRSPGWPWRFYASRALRLMPAYWLAVAAFAWFAGQYGFNPFRHNFPAGMAQIPSGFLYNLIPLVPQSFRLWNFSMPPPTHSLLLVPQSWALVIEWGFLLLAPLLVFRPKLAAVTLFLSLAYWLRFFPHQPGVEAYFIFNLAFFMLGVLAYLAYDRFLRRLPITPGYRFAALACAVTLALYLFFLKSVTLAIARPAALILFVPLATASIILLFHTARHVRWDRFIGDMAYPVFLFHPVVMAFFHVQGLTKWEIAMTSVPTCLLLAVFIVFFVDRPIARFRYRLK